MTTVSRRAEQIASFLVGEALGGTITPFDLDGRQNVVDFHLTRPDGSRAALEVTLVTDRRAMEWDGLARKDNRRWLAEAAWEYRPHGYRASYRQAREAAVRLAQMCDEAGVDSWRALRPVTREEGLETWQLADQLAGSLTRAGVRSDAGIRLFSATTVDFVDENGPDLVDLLEDWLSEPHVRPHVAKVLADQDATERHLFLVPVSDVLPARYFTDDFPAPTRAPRGYEGLDSLWLWSDYWHRFLRLGHTGWSWTDFPHQPVR